MSRSIKILMVLVMLAPMWVYATKADDISKALGWVNTPNADNLCRGYYLDTPLKGQRFHLKQGDTRISAQRGQFAQSGQSTLSGNVQVIQPDRELRADKAIITRDNNSRLTHIQLIGHVKLRQADKLLIAERADLYPQTKTGRLSHNLYRLHIQNDEGLQAWGEASDINKKDDHTYILNHASYSTCPALHPSWSIHAKRIVIDRQSQRGRATHVTFRIHHRPVLYLPFYSFSLSKARHSGFLTPTFGYKRAGGVMLQIPYYLNLAPNYDALLTGTAYTRRGLLWDGLFRYLTHYGQSFVHGSIMWGDKLYKVFRENPLVTQTNANRGSIQAVSDNDWTPNFSTHINVSSVSDPYYFQDFATDIAQVTTNQLLQQAAVQYHQGHWSAQAMVQRYQTLQPFNQVPTPNVYELWPDILINGDYPDLPMGTDFLLQGHYDHFVWPGPGFMPQGDRFIVTPTLSWPRHMIYGYVTPSLKAHLAQYQLQHAPSPLESNKSLALPMVSIDSGLYFDKTVHWMQHEYTQTLEPRAYYLFVPYAQQSRIPVFDSGYNLFTYDQLFADNRFSGGDRIGDANQLSLALTSRVIDDNTGLEKFSLGVGEIFYFKNRRVGLCQNGPGCTDASNTFGQLPATEGASPIVGQARYALSPHWSAVADYSYDPSFHQTNNATASVVFNPGVRKSINLSYSFIKNGDTLPIATGHSNNLNQITLGYNWPLNEHWSTIGAWRYNISHKFAMTYLAGVTYDSCCYSVRAIFARSFRSYQTAGSSQFDPRYHTTFYLQFLLKGVGAFGTGEPEQLINQYVANADQRFT